MQYYARMLAALCIVVWFLQPDIIHAKQSSFLYHSKPSLYRTSVADNKYYSKNCNAPVPFDDLVGKKVVFIAKNKLSRDDGYQQLFWMDGSNSFFGIPYRALVGKVGIIESIGPVDEDNGGAKFRHVIIKLKDSGRLIKTDALNDSISDITLLSDIKYGRKRWVGKTLWYRDNMLRMSTGEMGKYVGKRILKYQPVVVTNVLVGIDEANKVAFVVKFPDGTQGLVQATVSASNTSKSMLKIIEHVDHKQCSFDSVFMTSDPRKDYHWSSQIWSAIENSQVLIGMNVDQVIMAWGKPDQINSTNVSGALEEQWVYGSRRYVYFGGAGTVVAVQE